MTNPSKDAGRTARDTAEAVGAPCASKSPYAHLWGLDPEIDFLNHGSFGACPKAVLEAQRVYRDRLEREPVSFMVRELEQLLGEARDTLGQFVGAKGDDLAFVSNATTGVSTVLRSLDFSPGDELLTTDHVYGACKNALEFTAARTGARVVLAPVPFPIRSPDEVVDALLERVTPRTRLALLDHVTSPTALVFPVQRLVFELAARGVDALVDGAHSPGMVPLDLDALGAAYYTANCHKWLCAPKGAAFLHVRRDRQARVRPLVISHGAASTRADRSRFRLEFDWTGTVDPTAFLAVPDAIRFLEGLVPGGVTALMAKNHALALVARDTLCRHFAIAHPAPDAMLGSMATIPLPDEEVAGAKPPLFLDPAHDLLYRKYGIEVPIFPFPALPKRCLRITAQIYNTEEQYQRLVRALAAYHRAGC